MSVIAALRNARESRVTLVVVVTAALFLDEFLLTVVVPILPVIFLDECLRYNNPTVGYIPLGNVTGAGPLMAYGEERATDNETNALDDHVYTECERTVNTQLGVFLGSQFAVRVVISFFGNYMCEKFGYHLPMLVGCSLLIITTVVYAIAESYAVYMVGRMIHGLAAIPNDVGGLGLLAYRFRDNDERRGFVLGIALSGFAFGTMVSPPFGGVVFFYLGRAAPFIFIAGFLVLLALAEIAIYDHGTATQEKADVMATAKLLLDPLILVTIVVTVTASLGFGLLESSLPIWMLGTMDAEEWQLGVVFLPMSLTVIVGNVVLGYFAYKIGRWLCVAIALIVDGISVAMIPFAGSFLVLSVPMATFGLFFGLIDSTACSIFNVLVEKRHRAAYGGAATLSIVSFSIGFVIGPSLSAFLVNIIGFPWMLRGLGIVAVLLSPLCLFLRNTDRAPSSETNEDERMLILQSHKPETVACRQT
ncbi:synaptic vesicular amine transporter-like [Patiria miniata]|uniref:Major facilitator superfamily (MFS) profile domain-containing protein n=1 Tax=Patiria miniata TaxID=46514 RepID=A0A914BIC2_PATMI|nr:synaptic vesicular amine transporter-like [Patiria miniata]